MDKRIERIEHDIDGWWIYLKPGYHRCDDQTHFIVEDRKRDALARMGLVEPCDCIECRSLRKD